MLDSLETMIPVLPSIGTCFPSTCSQDDILLMFMAAMQELAPNLPLMFYPNACYTNEKPPLSTGAIVMM